MRLFIGGIEREAKVMEVPRGTYCSMKGYSDVCFPLLLAVCSPMTDEEKECGDTLVVPMFEASNGFEIEWANTLRNEVSVGDIRGLCMDLQGMYPKESLSSLLVDVVAALKHHGVYFTIPARVMADAIIRGEYSLEFGRVKVKGVIDD